jgi:cytochrome c biogenesis protein CcmG/thiol:disulfide interchange protein DsbE
VTRVRWIVTIVAVFVLATGIILAASLGHSSRNSVPGVLGHAAPDFSLPTLAGAGPAQLSAWRGQVVVLNFWNDWCIPCQQELPDLKQLNTDHVDDPLFAYAGIVHEAHSRRDIVDYVRAEKIRYTVAFDPGSSAALDYGVTGQPETFVIDKRGVVRNWISGPIDLPRLEALIAEYDRESA